MQRTLDQVLDQHGTAGPIAVSVAGVVARIAGAASVLRGLIAGGGEPDHITSLPEAGTGSASADRLVAQALRRLSEELEHSPLAACITRADETPRVLDAAGPVLLTLEPLSGAAEADAGTPVGVLFSVWPVLAGDPAGSLLQPGSAQLAAGLLVFGHRTHLALTFGAGVFLFEHDPIGFVAVEEKLTIPRGVRRYAIETATYRHWQPQFRAFIDDCIAGETGPLGGGYTMRWSGSLAAEAWRALRFGGVLIRPGNSRADGVSLIFEAFPIAFLAEQAGGEATTGRTRILDVAPRSHDHCVPLVFGSADQVTRVGRYVSELTPSAKREPLFGTRGLFRE